MWVNLIAFLGFSVIQQQDSEDSNKNIGAHLSLMANVLNRPMTGMIHFQHSVPVTEAFISLKP